MLLHQHVVNTGNKMPYLGTGDIVCILIVLKLIINILLFQKC